MDVFTPYRFSTLQTCDIDELAEAAKDWQQQYQQISKGKFQAQSWDIQFGGVELSWETANQSICQVGTIPPNTVAAGILFVPRGTSYFCGQSLNQDQLIFANGSEDYTVKIPPDYQLLTLKVNRSALETYADSIENWSMANQLQGKQLRQLTPGQAQSFKQLMETTLQQALFQPTGLGDELGQKCLTYKLFELMVTLAREVEAKPLTLSLSRAQTAVDTCFDYLRTHGSGCITVEMLCQVSGVSRRTLQTSFHKILGISPGQYLKTWRLNQVHQALKVADARETTVTAIAYDWGFFHLGHFCRSYQAQFGDRPSATLRQ
ncbi:helix-turn-helix domain-containing protein [Synechocystis salina LEGE 06155]|nr:helix-turn-helix domain-containing protein [Synechocystis salina LEGE 06155]